MVVERSIEGGKEYEESSDDSNVKNIIFDDIAYKKDDNDYFNLECQCKCKGGFFKNK